MIIKDTLKNIIKYPLTVCFGLFILFIFVLYFVIPDKELSEWENRYLEQKPEMRAADVIDGSFMEKYENYINDQIPFRDSFIKLKAVAETALLKVENNNIAKGKDSYLFTKDTKNSSVFDKNVGIIDQFVNKIDNPVTIMIAPNACGVYENKVPVGFPVVNQSAKLEELYADNSLFTNARVIKLNSVLSAHEDEYIYYRTDHHWTSLGAYYAYRELSENPVNISDLNCHTVDGFYGTLYAKYKGLLVKPDVITFYDIPVNSYVTDDTTRDGLYDLDKLNVFDKYGMFMWGNFGKCEIETKTGNGKNAVVFKDSYANCLIPFLTFDYEKITIIDLRYYSEPVSELINNNQEADVIFINNFDFLNEDNHFYKLAK